MKRRTRKRTAKRNKSQSLAAAIPLPPPPGTLPPTTPYNPDKPPKGEIA